MKDKFIVASSTGAGLSVFSLLFFPPSWPVVGLFFTGALFGYIMQNQEETLQAENQERYKRERSFEEAKQKGTQAKLKGTQAKLVEILNLKKDYTMSISKGKVFKEKINPETEEHSTGKIEFNEEETEKLIDNLKSFLKENMHLSSKAIKEAKHVQLETLDDQLKEAINEINGFVDKDQNIESETQTLKKAITKLEKCVNDQKQLEQKQQGRENKKLDTAQQDLENKKFELETTKIENNLLKLKEIDLNTLLSKQARENMTDMKIKILYSCENVLKKVKIAKKLDGTNGTNCIDQTDRVYILKSESLFNKLSKENKLDLLAKLINHLVYHPIDARAMENQAKKLDKFKITSWITKNAETNKDYQDACLTHSPKFNTQDKIKSDQQNMDHQYNQIEQTPGNTSYSTMQRTHHITKEDIQWFKNFQNQNKPQHRESNSYSKYCKNDTYEQTYQITPMGNDSKTPEGKFSEF